MPCFEVDWRWKEPSEVLLKVRGREGKAGGEGWKEGSGELAFLDLSSGEYMFFDPCSRSELACQRMTHRTKQVLLR